jgi:hypothetical protein
MKDAGPGGPTGHSGYLRKRTRVKEDLASLGPVGPLSTSVTRLIVSFFAESGGSLPLPIPSGCWGVHPPHELGRLGRLPSLVTAKLTWDVVSPPSSRATSWHSCQPSSGHPTHASWPVAT